MEKNKRKMDPILSPSGKVGWMDLGRRFPSPRSYAAYGTLFFYKNEVYKKNRLEMS